MSGLGSFSTLAITGSTGRGRHLDLECRLCRPVASLYSFMYQGLPIKTEYKEESQRLLLF